MDSHGHQRVYMKCIASDGPGDLLGYFYPSYAIHLSYIRN